MKILFLILSVFISIPLLAQETNNFKIENNSLIWQKVYGEKIPAEYIVKQLKSNGDIDNLEFSNNQLTGKLDIPANYKSAGFSEMNIPMYIPRNNIVCAVTIVFKENRYRVTLRNIKLKATMEDPLTKIGEVSNLDSYALKRGNSEFKNQFLKNPSKIYNYTFNKIFDIKEKKSDDNW